MKILIARTIPLLLIALSAAVTSAKEISLNDLPAAAKREAETELKSGTLKKVESVQQNGRTIYALTFQTANGTPKYVFLNPDGTYVHDQSLTAPATAAAGTAATSSTGRGQEVQLSQVPQPVQRTIQTELKNGPVGRIVQSTHNGNSMYEVFFNQPNGQQKTIYLNADGTYVQPGSAHVSSSGNSSWDTLNSGTSRQLSGNQRQLTFTQLPSSVQNAFRTEAGTSDIRNIQTVQLNGQSAYQGEIYRNGQHLQVRVDPNGRLLSTTPAPNSSTLPQR